MCGRFVMDYRTHQAITDLIEDKGLTQDEAMAEVIGHHVDNNYSVAPTNRVPIIEDQTANLANWGFLRTFGGRKQNLINARMDRLETARTWKRPLRETRCLVPMSGYYEWVDKQPWYLTSDAPLWAAGLFEIKDDQQYFTIVTTEGRDEAGRVHDRMPAFIEQDLWTDWLSGEITDTEAADLIGTVSESAVRVAAGIKTWPVSRRINSVRVDKADPTLIEPLTG